MSTSTPQPVQTLPTLPAQPFRLNVPLHDLLQRPAEPPHNPARVEHESRTSLALPSPVFPQHPALLHKLDAADIAEHEAVLQTGKRHWPASKVFKTMRGWMFPYFKSLPLQRTAEVPFRTYKPSQAALARKRLYPLTIFFTLYAIRVLALAFSTTHPWTTVAFFSAGWVTWTFVEYLFPRYVLHGRFPPGKGVIRRFLHERLDPLHISVELKDILPLFFVAVPVSFLFTIYTAPALLAGVERDFFQDKSKRNGQTSLTECLKSRELRCIRAWVF